MLPCSELPRGEFQDSERYPSPNPNRLMGPMKRSTTFLIVSIVGASCLWMGFQSARDDDFYAMRKNFELFGAVYEQVVGTYMVRVDPERIMRTGMDAMLETLDPWTDFLDEADNAAMRLRSQPGLGDVMLNLGSRAGRITVLTPDANVGAYKQGIRTGDVVVLVADQPADSLSLIQVYELLRGQAGSTVDVTIEREGEGPLDFVLKREAPVVEFVTFAERVAGTNIGMVRLSAFGPGAAHEVDNAIEVLEESGPLDGLVLDLRDNPGGLVDEAVNLVGLFVPFGTPVVSTRGRSPESNLLYSTRDEPDYPKLPLTLLMNRSSASASEILAGALQDLDRAAVVGEPSFGKGLVQVVRPMPYHTALKITFSRYYTPSGRGIRKGGLEEGSQSMQDFRTPSGRIVRAGNGIEPDVAVGGDDPGALEEALVREAAFFRYAGLMASTRGPELLAAAERNGKMVLPDDVISGFRAWLSQAGFEYQSELDEQLAVLNRLQNDGASVAAALEALRAHSQRLNERAFEAATPRIRAALLTELEARLLEPEVRLRNSLQSDGYVAKAVELIQTGRLTALLGAR